MGITVFITFILLDYCCLRYPGFTNGQLQKYKANNNVTTSKNSLYLYLQDVQFYILPLFLHQAIFGIQFTQTFVHKDKLAKGFNMFCVATPKWAVETFCTRKQMSLWTKCFHLPVKVVHFYYSLIYLLLFYGPSSTICLHGHHFLYSSFSYACHIIELEMYVLYFLFFMEHLFKEPHVKPINVLADISFQQKRNGICPWYNNLNQNENNVISLYCMQRKKVSVD